MKKAGALRPPPAPTKRERELDAVEPAWAKFAYGVRTGARYGIARDIRTLDLIGERSVHQNLEARHIRYEAGDTLELLHAVRYCGHEGVPMPQWLAQAFDEQMGTFLAVKGKPSLDDVFTSPDLPIPSKNPKSKNAPARTTRANHDLGVRIYRRMHAIHHEEQERRERGIVEVTSFDAALVKALADLRDRDPRRAWPGKTRARELVRQVEERALSVAHVFGRRTKPLSDLFAEP